MAIDYNGCEEEWLTGKLANLSATEVEQTVDDNYKEPISVISGVVFSGSSMVWVVFFSFKGGGYGLG